MQKIIVASKNPVKIHAARSGFEKMFPTERFEIEGISVPSEVAEQPMSNVETLVGATNRVKNAFLANKNAAFWVGIEGGVAPFGDELEAFAWVVVLSTNKMGKAKTATFFLPKPVVDLINQGMELGEADDKIFGKTNSKQQNGAVGLLTNDVMTRAGLYEEAVKLALVPFKNEELY